jgi:aspartyl-tRNA(Asn)/glutamyl-tRNA(Gln) amidotransferase subunit A
VGQRALAGIYRDLDLIVTPTASAGATSFAALGDAGRDGIGPVHTAYWNAVGNPVLSIPMGLAADGMPLGLQIAGRPFDELTVLRAGDAFQTRTAWHLEVPPMPHWAGVT